MLIIIRGKHGWNVYVNLSERRFDNILDYSKDIKEESVSQ